ncbi:Ribonuclease p 40kda subunit [Neofusicoccum parvum]|uniref:Ribonuclease p 40kda subunit n=1 Tax=Neofusicoccum parvum TaxID=310453 RepID=A0ACB5RRG5_9PEZI|nr:Ribonuclease p 40kda subunit [Neofusicoccum parvum]
MLGIENSDAPTSKCYFTHAVLGEHVDERQPPTKKKPFSTILAQPFSHTADLILPEEIYELIKQEFDGAAGTFHYARVIMSLGEIIDGDFFNQYIKTAVEMELRKPSMLHGKKGFERIVWAFKNVLNQSVTWLFHDLQSSDKPPSGPILAHHPQLQAARPDLARLSRVKLPALTSLPDLCDPEYGAEVLEWFGLVSLGSPRIDAADDLDSFLSRYTVPMPYRADGDADEPSVRTVARLRWRGLVPPMFLLRLWMAARKGVASGEVSGGEAWMALSVAGFGGEAYTMLGVGARDVLSWECR